MSKDFENDEDFETVSLDKKSSRSLDDLDMDYSGQDSNDSEAARRMARADKRRKKQKKSHGGLGLILVILLIIAVCAGLKLYANSTGRMVRELFPFFQSSTQETKAETETETTEAETEAADQVVFTKDGNAEILALVQSYYDARLAGDTETLTTILAEGASVDSDAVSSESQFVEGYQDIATYVTDGAKQGEYAVYVSYSMKFKDIDTPAPGLQPAYVTTDSDGNLRLAFYSDFDSETKSFMNTISGSQAVTDLAGQVTEAYQAAQEADPDLKEFLSNLAGEVTEAETTVAETTEAATTAAGETTAAATTAAAEVTFTETDDIQYTKTQVKLRTKPSLDDSVDYILVDEGIWVHVWGISDEWSKVTTQDGYNGYIYNEYLTPDKP